MEAPKCFWKFYDQFRRKKITIKEFSRLSGIKCEQIRCYLKDLRSEEKSDEKRDERWYNIKN